MGLDDGLAYVESLSDVEAIFVTKRRIHQYTSGIGKTIPFELLDKDYNIVVKSKKRIGKTFTISLSVLLFSKLF